MIKSTTQLCVLDLNWYDKNREMEAAALEENGSIVDGSERFSYCIIRNKSNHEKALQCVVHLLTIRRWRNGLNNFPKEMVRMIAIMLWMMRCDVGAWTISDKPARKKARSRNVKRKK